MRKKKFSSGMAISYAPMSSFSAWSYTPNGLSDKAYQLPYNAKKRCDSCGAPYKPGEIKCSYCGTER